jgi:ribose transport system substrate-binding protein
MKRLQKLTIFSLLMALFGSLLVGCAQDNGKKTIGLSQATLESPFYVSLTEAAKEEAKKRGMEIIATDAQSDIEKQNRDIQDLITKGVDVLIVNPTNPTAVKPALEAAKRANIPVITVDRPTEQKVTSFVGRDNKQMGKLAGQKAIDLLGGKGKAKGKVIEIQGDAGGKVMQDRHGGFHSVVDQEKGIQVVEGPYCDYVRSKAVKAFQDLLQAHPDVNLVYAHNDDMALGALQVLKQQNLLGKVKVVGIDGLSEAVKAIVDGQYEATVFNDPVKLGKLTIDTAVKVSKGEKVPEYVDAGTGLIDQNNAQSVYNKNDVFAQMK